MLLKVRAPDIERESEIIHETMQRVLSLIAKTDTFRHAAFNAVSRIHKNYTGNRVNSHILPFIEACCGLDHKEKRTFQLAHKADRKFNRKVQGFRFSAHRNRQVPKCIVQLMTETYYNVFADRGFRGRTDETIDRLWLIAKFKEANRHLKCCPYCGETLKYPHQQNSGNVTLDHFFPESKYPTLAVALLNLLPVCSDCNSKYKKTNDPLENQRAPGELENVCLPYEDPLADELELRFHIDPQGDDIVTVTAKPGCPAIVGMKVANFVRYTELNKKWSFELVRIREELVEILIRQVKRNECQGPADIIQYMNGQCYPEDVRDLIHYSPYKLLEAAYYQWLVIQPQRVQDLWDACR